MEGIECFKAIDSFGALGQVQLITSTQLEIVRGVIHYWSQHWRKRRARSYIKLSILRREGCAGGFFFTLSILFSFFLPLTVKEVCWHGLNCPCLRAPARWWWLVYLFRVNKTQVIIHLAIMQSVLADTIRALQSLKESERFITAILWMYKWHLGTAAYPRTQKGLSWALSLHGSEKCCWSKQVLTQRGKKPRSSKEETNVRSSKITFQIPNYPCFLSQSLQ